MKLFQTIRFGAVALALSGFASAAIEIHFAASNGDRNATQTAIAKLLDDGWSYRGTSGYVGNQDRLADGATLTGTVRNSNFGTWKGVYNGQEVIIRTNYAGALAGIAAVAGNTTPRFDTSNGEPGDAIENPLTATDPANYREEQVDFGLSTNFQSTSPFNGLYNGVIYETVSEENVGISPLGFYASPGFPADNITSQVARQLYSAGSVPLSLFTGSASDANKIVYAIGRNTDAGQRYSAQLEIGLGPGTAWVWKPTVEGATTTETGVNGFIYGGTVTSHEKWEFETNSGIYESGGFNGGATLAPALTVTLSPEAYRYKLGETGGTPIYRYPDAVAGYYIGYLTPGDADGRVLGLNADGTVAAGRDPGTIGVKLKYNGVENTQENIKSGQYTLWLYNRILRRISGVADKAGDPAGFRAGFVDALSSRIKLDAATGGGIRLDDSALKVERFADGGIVYPIE